VTGRLKLAAQMLALALVTGLFALLVWKLATEDEDAASKLGRGGTPVAPVFRLDRLDRPGDVSLAAYRGRPVVLNFWASWCEPCKQEAPLLESVWRRYRDRGLVVIGLDFNDLRSDARRFARENRMSYPLAYDGHGDTLTDYGVVGAPETFFIDRTGRLICERLQGAVHLERNRERFDTCVRALLAA
jgi:cytochrome c biogenesis protein CcmG, thiol:disulfide interchange protein DsbE